MTRFVNDGSWFYLGNRNGDMVYVKGNECVYVDKSGEIVQSPEERELLKKAEDNLKRIKGKGL